MSLLKKVLQNIVNSWDNDMRLILHVKLVKLI